LLVHFGEWTTWVCQNALHRTNGIVERFGATLAEMMRRLKAEMPKYDFSMLLNKAVLAHNSLASNLGFTLLQIVQDRCESVPSFRPDFKLKQVLWRMLGTYHRTAFFLELPASTQLVRRVCSS
jgi:hypothetical protein